MPYDTNDPRSQLERDAHDRAPAGAAFAPQYFEFGDLVPDDVSAGGTKTWITCGARRCASSTPMSPRETAFTRTGQPDEYMVLLPSPDAAARRPPRAKRGHQREVRGRDAARRQRARRRHRADRSCASSRPRRMTSSRSAATGTSTRRPTRTSPRGSRGPIRRPAIASVCTRSTTIRQDTGRFGRLLRLQHDHGQLLLSGRRRRAIRTS